MYTVDRFYQKFATVGHAVLNIFVEIGTEKQPTSDSANTRVNSQDKPHLGFNSRFKELSFFTNYQLKPPGVTQRRGPSVATLSKRSDRHGTNERSLSQRFRTTSFALCQSSGSTRESSQRHTGEGIRGTGSYVRRLIHIMLSCVLTFVTSFI